MIGSLSVPRPTPWQQLARVWAPSDTSSNWHVSPGIDLVAYGFSWVFLAVPMWIWVRPQPESALAVFIVTTLITDLHRHYTLPYVYLDRDVRSRYPLRFWLLPAVLFAFWTQTPAISRSWTPLSAPSTAAMLAWLLLVVQLMKQDRGGSFQLKRALPCFLSAVAAASALTLAEPSFDLGWVWLGSAVVCSLVLFFLVQRDGSGDPLAGSRNSSGFPLLIATFGALAALAPAGAMSIDLRFVANLFLVTFLLWHFYHVIMQKYGILRIYSGKSGQSVKVPGWVDRFLLASPLPAIFVWVGGRELDPLLGRLAFESSGLEQVAGPTLALLGRHFEVLMALAGVYAAAAVAIFVFYEWKVHRLRNVPRVAFAVGTLLFYGTFFALGLFNFYSVFAFAHGIEYMVFIWAFQRRRYRGGVAHAPTLSRLVRHPVAFYGTYTVALVAILCYSRYQAEFPALAFGPPLIFGETAFEWIRWYTLYQGILHFYYDGFLWKMRRPELAAHM